MPFKPVDAYLFIGILDPEFVEDIDGVFGSIAYFWNSPKTKGVGSLVLILSYT